jgi:arylsulfatase A-like enzyme
MGAVLLLSGVCAFASVGKKNPPNVVLIMTDDQGYGDLSCHGNPILKTPHLDTLSGESLNLSDFHVSPFCAPTRASLMTGRLAARGRVWSTVNNGKALSRNEVTIADYFKASGYTTGHFGKWHLGHSYPYRPMDRGFDEWVGVGDAGNGTADDYWANDRVNDHYLHNGEWEFEEGYCTDVFFDKTMGFIKDCKKKKKPFFAYLASNAPHGPFSLPLEWENEYKGKVGGGTPWGSTFDFFKTIARIDHNVGRLRTFLEEEGLTDNTIFIFLTDNGTSGASSHKVFNAGMRGKKGSLYEGGHRVPCFIHWPAGGLDKKSTFEGLTSCTDILPTLKDLCGLSDPERQLNPLDGISLARIIEDPKASWPERTLIYHVQNGTPKPAKWGVSVVLHNKWRLVRRGELYNVENDFPQKLNVAAEHPDVVKMLLDQYDTYWETLDTRSFKDNPNRYIIGSRKQKKVFLTGADGIHIDASRRMRSHDATFVLAGSRYNNYWPLEVEKTGDYKIEVRRWPRSVSEPMRAGLPAQKEADAQLNGKPWLFGEGKAINVKEVVISVDGKEYKQAIKEGQQAAVFTVPLTKGDLDLKAELVDEKGRFSAYFVYIEKN